MRNCPKCGHEPEVRFSGSLPIYTRFRDDGWPLCPRCGEDELYSLAIPATIETIVGCYRCGWRT